MRHDLTLIAITIASGFMLISVDRLIAQQREAPPVRDELDAELLKELGKAVPEELGEDIGRSSSADDPLAPLERIGGRMRSAQRLLAEKDASGQVSRLQTQIVADLDALIREAKRRKSESTQGGKSSPGSQRSDARPQGAQPQQQGREGEQSAADSDDELRQGGSAAAAADMRTMREQVFKNIWGHLPERVREQVLQSQDDEFLPKYELEIEQYFRRLAEDSNLDGR